MKHRAPLWAALLLAVLLCACSSAAVSTTGESTPPLETFGPPPSRDPEEPEPTPTPVLTLEDVRTVTLSDLTGDEEWADCASYAVYQGLMETEDGVFDPDRLVTCGEVAEALDRFRVLFREEETPEEAIPVSVVISQAGEDSLVTRSELAECLAADGARKDGYVLVKLADDGSQVVVDYPVNLEEYVDVAAVAEEAAPALSWTLDNGVYTSIVSDAIYPGLPVTRAQLAQVLVSYSALTEEPLAVELAGQLQPKQVDSACAAHHEELQAVVDSVAARYGVTGLQVAVVEDGVVTDSFAYGWATKNTDRMTADHKLRVASISKVAVGIAAMRLRQQGLLDLDEPIGTYWGFSIGNPYFPNDPVTIRTILSHTSSIIVYGDDVSRSGSAIQSKLRTGCFSRTQPGNVGSWNYNNYAFGVLGVMLERISGQYMDDILEEVWAPMGIDAAFVPSYIDHPELLTTLYYSGGAVSRSIATQRSYARASEPGGSGSAFAGGLTISANDLAKVAALLANDGYYQGIPLLSRESVELMETRFEKILPDGTYQALPLRSQDNLYGRDRIYYHTGSAYGVFNCFSYDPETRDGVVVLTVGGSGAKDERNIYASCSAIAQAVYDTIAQERVESSSGAANQ